MRTIPNIVLMGWLIVFSSASTFAQDSIPWLADWREARALAKQQHRLVLFHFYSDSCVPCQKLERNVFNRPEVIRAVTAGYVPVKINIDQSPQLASFYRVNDWPKDVIVDASGREVYRSTSPQDANQYVALLSSVRAHNSVGMQPPEHNGIPAPQRTQTAGFGQHNADQFAQGPGGEFGQLQNDDRNSDFHPQAGTASSQFTATPKQSPYIENQFANSQPDNPKPLNNNAAPKTAGVAPRYGNPYGDPQPGSQTESQPDNNSAPWNAEGQSNAPSSGGSFQVPQGSSQSQGHVQNNPQTGPVSGGPGAGTNHSWQSGANTQPGWQQQVAGPPSSPRVAQQYGRDQFVSNRAPANPPTQSTAPQRIAAMDGFCPVSLVLENKWVKGDKRFGAIHLGQTYLFTTQQNQQQFLADPDRYSPVLSGFDAVKFAETGQFVTGKREFGVFYQNRIFLFADEIGRARFEASLQNADYYASRAHQAMRQNAAGTIPR